MRQCTDANVFDNLVKPKNSLGYYTLISMSSQGIVLGFFSNIETGQGGIQNG